MKKQPLNEEFRRMQKLAGIILTENKYPEEFTPFQTNEDDNELYDGEVIAAYSAPMEGWDENNNDTVVIVKKEDGYYVDGYIAFGEFEVKGPFNTQQEAEKTAYDTMQGLIDDWE